MRVGEGTDESGNALPHVVEISGFQRRRSEKPMLNFDSIRLQLSPDWTLSVLMNQKTPVS